MVKGVLQPSRMKAAVFKASTQEVELVSGIAIPLISDDEVLLKVDYCGVCVTDWKKINHYNHFFQAGDRIFGHEIVGTVVRGGSKVSNIDLGDRCVVFHHVPCEDCNQCREGLYAQCKLYQSIDTSAGYGEPAGGGFAEYIRIPGKIVQKGLMKIPDKISFKEAVNIEPLDCVHKGIRQSGLKEGDGVAIIGFGFIGFLTLQLALYYGAKISVLVDINLEQFNKMDNKFLGVCCAPSDLVEKIAVGILSPPQKTFVAVESLDAILSAVLITEVRGEIVFLQDRMPSEPFFDFVSHLEMVLQMVEKYNAKNLAENDLLNTLKKRIKNAKPGDLIRIEVSRSNISAQECCQKEEWSVLKNQSSEKKIKSILRLMASKKLTAIGSYSSSGVDHEKTAKLVFNKEIDLPEEVNYIPLEELPSGLKQRGKRFVIEY